MSLLALQRDILAQLLSDDVPLRPEWDTRLDKGLAVYRNAYRARLVGCLREMFDKSWSWIGDESFDAAACHHLILHPPHSWTLDDIGMGFSDTLSSLFPNDPEVEELAWLEWTMQRAFCAADVPALSASDFTTLTTDYDEGDWTAMRLVFVPSLYVRPIRTACVELWNAMTHEQPMPSLMLEKPATLIVWREGMTPCFRMLAHDESLALAMMQCGESFGASCEMLASDADPQAAIATAGSILGRWIAEGLIAEIQ